MKNITFFSYFYYFYYFSLLLNSLLDICQRVYKLRVLTSIENHTSENILSPNYLNSRTDTFVWELLVMIITIANHNVALLQDFRIVLWKLIFLYHKIVNLWMIAKCMFKKIQNIILQIRQRQIRSKLDFNV